MNKSLTFARNIFHDVSGESRGIQYDNIPGIDSGPVSLAIWAMRLETQSGTEQGMVFIDQTAGDGDDDGAQIISLTDSSLRFRVRHSIVSAEVIITDPWPIDEWAHVVCTWTGDSSDVPRGYLNGIDTAASSTTPTGTRSTAPGSHSIGGREGTLARGFGGLLAGAARWQRVITPAEAFKLSRGLHPLDLHPHDLVICPDFHTLENLAPNATSRKPNLVEMGAGTYNGPPQLRYPKLRFATVELPSDIRIALVDNEFTKKPPVNTPIDFGISLTNGLVFASTFNGSPQDIADNVGAYYARDLVQGTIPITEGDSSSVVRYSTGADDYPILRGMCHFQDPTGGEVGYDYGELDAYKPGTLTIVCAANHLDAVTHPSGARLVSYSTGGGDDYAVFPNGSMVRARIDGANYDIVDIDIGNDNCVSYALANDPDNGSDGIKFQIKNHTTGEIGQVTAPGDSNIDYTGSTGLFIGYNGPASDRYFSGEIYYIYIFDRVLAQSEIESIWANPWQIFKHRQFIPFNEKLPEVAQFEVEHTNMPARP